MGRYPALCCADIGLGMDSEVKMLLYVGLAAFAIGLWVLAREIRHIREMTQSIALAMTMNLDGWQTIHSTRGDYWHSFTNTSSYHRPPTTCIRCGQDLSRPNGSSRLDEHQDGYGDGDVRSASSCSQM